MSVEGSDSDQAELGLALRESNTDLGGMSKDPGSGALTSKLEPLSKGCGQWQTP